MGAPGYSVLRQRGEFPCAVRQRMLELRLYKLLVLVAFTMAIYTGMAPRGALIHTAVLAAFVFVSDWLTSFVVP